MTDVSRNAALHAAPARIIGAPVSAHDQPFYRFWYGHMVDEQMTGRLRDVDHSTARYIWDAALASQTPRVRGQDETKGE